jgi:hypothetical protein
MNDNDLDRMLREYAPRWQAAQPPPPTVDAAVRAAASGRPSSVRWFPVLAAAAAVAIVAAGIGLARWNAAAPQRPGVTPTPSTTTSTLVAWQPLPATHPVIPTRTVAPPSPDPTHAATLPACTTADLIVSTSTDGAAGTRFIVLEFRADTPCRIAGYPSVTPMGHQGDTLPVPVEQEPARYGGRAVEVSRAAVASMMLGWSSNWCATAVDVAVLRLGLPGGGGEFTIAGFGPSQCYGEPGSGTKSPIRVQDFQPQQQNDPRVLTAFEGTSATVHIVEDASAGRPLRFSLVLTAPPDRDVPLTPCPDYSIRFGHEDNLTAVEYALNCAAVPHRDRDGKPYLPAGVPVTFEMQVTAPPSPSTGEKLVWQLLASDFTDTVVGTGDTIPVG